MKEPPAVAPEEKEQMLAGRTAIFHLERAGEQSLMYMGRLVDSRDPDQGMLVGEINFQYLWGIGSMNILPPMTEMFVFDHRNRLLVSSLAETPSWPELNRGTSGDSSPRNFTWQNEGKTYLANSWPLFLKTQFYPDQWILVLSQSRETVLSPVAKFKHVFPLIVLMALWIVLLLSVILIRRNLVPLEKLKEGTLRLARGDFDSRVSVTSGDEFEELAGSFNNMAGQIDRQFKMLGTIAEIDRAILSTLDTKQIVHTLLDRLPEVLPCESVGVSLLDPNYTSLNRVYFKKVGDKEATTGAHVFFSPDEIEELRDHPFALTMSLAEKRPSYLAHLPKGEAGSAIVLPIFLNEQLAGIISLGFKDGAIEREEDLAHARQLSNQVAVALSNARLIGELDRLNWQTLLALARTVDAKSSWTAGHSERVTALSVEVGEILGLPEGEMNILHRAGLLHDIGKIGVPAAILDKPAKLTDEEYQIVKGHSRAGGRILEPINAYAEVIPIVVQHHEWYNGKGYPGGLAGEEICYGARILALADVYDALASDRPYRAGMEPARVLEILKNGLGTQFDPEIGQVFLDHVKSKVSS